MFLTFRRSLHYAHLLAFMVYIMPFSPIYIYPYMATSICIYPYVAPPARLSEALYTALIVP